MVPEPTFGGQDSLSDHPADGRGDGSYRSPHQQDFHFDMSKSADMGNNRYNQDVTMESLTSAQFRRSKQQSDFMRQSLHQVHNPYKVDNPGAFGYICRILKLGVQSDDYHIYEGQISESLKRHGYGRCILKTGEWYQGHWNNDRQHGLGRAMILRDGQETILDGEWLNGKLMKNKKITRW